MLNIRQPAYTSVFPETSKWETPSTQELEILQQHVSGSLTFKKRSIANCSGLLGYYRTIGNQKLFIKIVSNQDHKSQSGAEKIARWLFDSGLSVRTVYDNFPKKIKQKECWIYIYDYFNHKFDLRNCDELKLVGKEVGKMHKLMQENPYHKKVYFNGEKKNNYLFEKLKEIKSDIYPTNFSADAIELVQNTTYDEYHELSEYAQMVHGDLNFGNIIFQVDNYKPIIIDFEDSVTAWINPLYDIAFIIQRFILLSGTKNKLELSRSFINGYKSENIIKCNNNCFMVMLKMISIRSLLVLSTLGETEQKFYKSEVNKFVLLHKKMIGEHMIISEIEDMF